MMSESWEKSSYSNGGGGQCVEARLMMSGEIAAVRDTQNRELGYLGFAPREWAALLSTITTK